MDVCPYSYFPWCGHFRGPWLSFVTTDEFSVRVKEITSMIGVSWTHRLPFWFWLFFNIMKWPYYQKDENQINLNHKTLWNLALPIFEVFVRISLNVNLFFNHFPDIPALCDTNLDDSIDSGNFTVRGYLSLLQKDSITHMHGLVLYVKKYFLLHGTYLYKTLRILTYVFDWLYFTQCLTSFPWLITFFAFMHGFWCNFI